MASVREWADHSIRRDQLGARHLIAIRIKGGHLAPGTIVFACELTLEVLDGLTAQDWIVLNPADSLEDGQQVQPAEAKASPPPCGAPACSRR